MVNDTTLAAGAAVVLGLLLAKRGDQSDDDGNGDDNGESDPDPGPESPIEGWSLTFEDTFDGDGLDPEHWSHGWGWGHNADYTPATSDADGAWVEDGLLKQAVWREGDQHYVGNVNTKNGAEFSPPVYVEARIRCMDLPGANNAFWAKPATEAWPPEIDVMEVHRDSADEALDHSIHNLHYSPDGGVNGDHSEINNASVTLQSGDYQDGFHTFGALWTADEIEHYLDGDRIGRSTDQTMLDSMAAGAPFYFMLSMQTIGAGGWLGDVPDESWDNYDTVMETEWVRAWAP